MLAALTLALAAAPVPVPKAEGADWKPVIKERALKFDAAQKAAADALTETKKAGYTADFAADANGFGHGDYTFAKKDGPKVVLPGHPQSAFALRGDVVYFADFSPIANGCKLVAYDLATGKRAWEKALDGIGVVEHTKYRNRVTAVVEKHPTVKDAFALVVTGWEAAGAYIEVIDLATGKQLAHKKFAPGDIPK